MPLRGLQMDTLASTTGISPPVWKTVSAGSPNPFDEFLDPGLYDDYELVRVMRRVRARQGFVVVGVSARVKFISSVPTKQWVPAAPEKRVRGTLGAPTLTLTA